MQATSVLTLYRTSIGKKWIMAVTGLIGIGYVAIHMYGNLKVFQGPEYFNHYAESLRAIGAPIFMHLHLLMIARFVLLAAIILHVWAAVTLYRQAQSARVQTYQMKRTVQANYAATTIRYGGVVILLFILFHLAQLTWGVVDSTFDRTNPYGNVVHAFQNPFVAIFYLIALFALGLHLYHGAWSMFQTLGFLNRKYDPFVRGLAILLALVIPIGFAAVPLAVLFGFVQ
ncbi:MAG: succinate dehydrogenase cytochrome b subunit [Caldilineaceae bacterium]|nr:succinate dehydrogenase cytochrome b subunit [Caldilineaceae bacterium]MCB9137020.1 succinate dehydrogenase cytochrome b subunit [Caldilineaceae bacterium]